MQSINSKWLLSKNKYTQLILIQIFLFFVASAFLGNLAEILVSLALLVSIVLIIRTFYIHKKLLPLYISIVCFAFLFDFLYLAMAETNHKNSFLLVIGDLVFCVFLALAIYLMTTQLYIESDVTKDTVVGGICIFLLIGDLWFVIYESLYILNSRSFSYGSNNLLPFDLLYFSFTTLTTLGYGDILPVSAIAKVMANLEGIVGVMYPAIFISRLVGLYNSELD